MDLDLGFSIEDWTWNIIGTESKTLYGNRRRACSSSMDWAVNW